MIYVLGNSHANFFTNIHPSIKNCWGVRGDFASYSFGPTTAYHLFDKYIHNIFVALSLIRRTENDYILPMFGEVDCRVHLIKQSIIQERPIKDVVQDCVNKMVQVHDLLLERGYNIIAWGGQASSPKGHEPDNDQEPTFGTSAERNYVTILWSDCMKEYADNKNLPYCDIIYPLINQDLTTKPEYLIDYCHLNHNLCMPFIVEQLKEQNVI